LKKIFLEIRCLPEFEKDIHKLSRRFKTIEDDLRIFIEKELKLFHKLKIDNKGIFHIPGLQIENPKIFKAKKFACRSLKGKGVHSGIRLIYAYFEEENIIELIEIYYKGDKENEDRQRIFKYYKRE
jgi:mRNA-degrading endonuclease RelE of RelBE toxin-antitoxin system